MTEGQKTALVKAAKMLGLRMMTRKQLVDKLIEKDISEDDAIFAVESLEQMKAMDDLEYACRYVAYRSARGYGEVRIRRELRQRGVDDDFIDIAMKELPDPSETIENFIVSRAREIPLDKREASRLSGALRRKGFLWDEISPILREYTEEYY